MHGSPFKYFAYGAAATEVEVDGFTGEYRTRRVDIVHDVGDSLSPSLVDLGQIEGAFVQGAGWLTLDLRWDEGDGRLRGRLATQAASTYKLPSFSEMPEVFHVALLERPTRTARSTGPRPWASPRSCSRSPCVSPCVRRPPRSARRAPRRPASSPRRRRCGGPWTGRRRSGHGHVSEGAPGIVPDQPDVHARPLRPHSERRPSRHGRVADIGWLDAVERLRRDRLPRRALRHPVAVRGHRASGRSAPRWSSAPSRPGAASGAATSRRPRWTARGRCSWAACSNRSRCRSR